MKVVELLKQIDKALKDGTLQLNSPVKTVSYDGMADCYASTKTKKVIVKNNKLFIKDNSHG